MPRFLVRTGLVPTLWVNASTGDDSRSKATVTGSGGTLPWATLGRAAWGSTTRSSPNAAEAAAAGDVVSVAAGTYNYGSAVSGRFEVCYNPANDGTSNAPIVFRAEGAVVLTGSSAASPAIGSASRDYIHWLGPWTVNEATWLVQADTGPVVLNDCTGCLLDGLIVTGMQVAYNDNNPGIRLETATDCAVRDCTVSGFYKSDPDNHNGCAIQLYGSQACVIEHNTLSDCASGIFFKDTNGSRTQYGNIVRYNWLDGCREGLAFSIVSATVADDRNFVYQNVVLRGSIGISMLGSTNDHIYANTFVTQSQAGISFKNANISGARAWSNIYVGCDRVVYADNGVMPAASVLSHQHHCVQTYTQFYQGTDGNRSLVSYLGAYADQDQDAPDTIDSDPLFVNAGTDDYRLQAGSPARDLGRHPGTDATIHAGAYQTGTETIGVRP